MMDQEKYKLLKEMLDTFGWLPLHSRNPIMVSFFKGAVRMNVYFTRMTVTFQSDELGIKTHRDVTIAQLEELIEDYR